MGRASQPDRLPFGIAEVVGLPYHGKVYGGEVTLPNASTKTHPQPSTGSVYKVQHQLAQAPTLTPEQQAAHTAAGKQWLDYAYLSGDTMMIGGQELGLFRWLYCDGNRTWVMRIEKNFDDRTVDVYVEKLFGVFNDQTYETIDRKILAYEPVSDWLFNSPSSFVLRYFPSKTGAKVAINLMYGYSYASGRIYSLPTTAMRANYSGTYNDLEEALTLTISGTGSTATATLGQGISAGTTLHVAGFENTYTYMETGAPDSGYLCHGQYYSAGTYPDCTGDSGSYEKDWTWGWSYAGTLLYYMSSEGALRTVSYAWSILTNASATAEVVTSAHETSPGIWVCKVDSVDTTEESSTALNYSITVGGSVYSYPEEIWTYSKSCSWTLGDAECDCNIVDGGDFWGNTTGDYLRYARLFEGQYIQIKTGATDNENVRVYSIENGDYADHVGVEDHCAYDMENGTFYFGTSINLVGVV